MSQLHRPTSTSPPSQRSHPRPFPDGPRRERAKDRAGMGREREKEKSGNPESPQRDQRLSLSLLLLNSTPATLPGIPFFCCALESQCAPLPTFSFPSSDGEEVVRAGSAGGGELARKTYRLLLPPLRGRRSNSEATLPGPPGAGLCSPSPDASFCCGKCAARAGGRERIRVARD